MKNNCLSNKSLLAKLKNMKLWVDDGFPIIKGNNKLEDGFIIYSLHQSAQRYEAQFFNFSKNCRNGLDNSIETMLSIFNREKKEYNNMTTYLKNSGADMKGLRTELNYLEMRN